MVGAGAEEAREIIVGGVLGSLDHPEVASAGLATRGLRERAYSGGAKAAAPLHPWFSRVCPRIQAGRWGTDRRPQNYENQVRYQTPQ